MQKEDISESESEIDSKENGAKFSYSNIKDIKSLGTIEYNNYEAYYIPFGHMINFITFKRKPVTSSDALEKLDEEVPEAHGELSKDEGWKLHISLQTGINEEDLKEDNLEKAWNVVFKILMKHNITESKVVTDKVWQEMKIPGNKYETPKFLGKQITIYTFRDADSKNPEDWCDFVQDLENGLIEAGVKPGVKNIKDTRLPGSKFLGYRSDEADNTFSAKVDSVNPLLDISLEECDEGVKAVYFPPSSKKGYDCRCISM